MLLDALKTLTHPSGWRSKPHRCVRQAVIPLDLTVFGIPCRCLGLDRLIQVKRAAGRPKDLEAIAELKALREERGRS